MFRSRELVGGKPKKRARGKRVASVRPLPTICHSHEEAFVEVALVGLTAIAQRHSEFTTDELWLWLAVYAPDIEVPEPRAMGAVMRAATKRKLCTPSNKTKRSTRAACHGRPVRVWISLVPAIDAGPSN